MNYFLEAFKKYSDFDGRASRKEFWLFVLFNMIACAAIQIIAGKHSILLQIYLFKVKHKKALTNGKGLFYCQAIRP